MPVKYRVIQRNSDPRNPSGPKKFYASTVSNGESEIESLITSIEKISTVSGADIRGVIYALVDVITSDMADGKIVRLGELGSLRVSISSSGEDNEKDVSANNIKGAKILFTPGSKLKDMLKLLKYQKE